MRSTVLCIFFAAAVFSQTSHAGDLGYRYNGQNCVNKAGMSGHNPGFYGQCGDFTGASLSGLNLDNMDLSGSIFDDANLQLTSLVGANLTGVSFIGSQLSGAILVNATLHAADFNKAIMTNTHLGGADILNCDFSDADLTAEVLSTVSLGGSKFVGAILVGAALDYSDLTGCDLSKANLSQAKLQSAKLDKTTLDGTVLIGADLTHASLQNVKGDKSNLSRAIVRLVNLNGAILTMTNMRGAQLDGAKITGANLSGSRLKRAVLKNADLTGSIFTGVIIDNHTVLPIPLDEAEKMGMILDNKIDLLVVGSDYDETPSLITALKTMDLDVETSSEGVFSFAGDVDLSQYSAVLLNPQNCFDMPTLGQQALVKFVHEGGKVINMGMIFYCKASAHRYQNMSDLIPLDGEVLYQGPVQFSVSGGSTSPVLSEVPPKFVARDMTVFIGKPRTSGSSPVSVLLTDSNNDAILVTRDFGTGHVVQLATSAIGYNSCFEDRNIQQIIGNAALW